MARKFNLQPWREQAREAQKKQFITNTIVLILITLGLFIGYYLLKKSHIDEQVQANQKLLSEINALQTTKKEVDLTKKLNAEITKQIGVIQDLQNRRSLTVKVLNFLAEKTPTDVFLRSVSYSNNVLTINGTAENQGSVSAFVTELKSFPLLDNVFANEIVQATNNPRYTVAPDTAVSTFTLTANVKPDADGKTTQE